MSVLLDAVSWLCLGLGGLACMVGALGLLRMPDLFTRVHAASLVDSVGAGLILLGLAIQAGLTLVMVKLVFIAVFIFFTSPTATHALARAALYRGMMPQVDEGGAPSKL